MFERAGHSVTTWRTLSPRLVKADTIVWFPNDFQPPSQPVRTWFEDWLAADPGRTLVYVGRDFDAAPSYWRNARPLAPANLQPEFDRRKDKAANDAKTERGSLRDVSTDWFDIKVHTHRDVRTLDGPWSAQVDAGKTELELNSFLVPASDADILLESAGDVLASRQSYQPYYSYGQGDSQIIVVANGSFLLNFPLVNHEHRKLAGKLIAQVGPAGKTVFLESDVGGPRISDEDPANNPPTGLEIFAIWPMSFILLHIAAVGIIFCFARAPIFGTARDPNAESRSDFGRHLRALGELLAGTHDRTYAEARLKHYHQNVRGDAEKGRKKAKPEPDGPADSPKDK